MVLGNVPRKTIVVVECRHAYIDINGMILIAREPSKTESKAFIYHPIIKDKLCEKCERV